MKKLFLFNFLLVMIFGLAINVNAASAPFYCMSFSSYADGAKADTMNEAISLYEGDQKQLYVYVAMMHDMPPDVGLYVSGKASSSDYTLVSKDTTIATVDSTGKVHAVKAGTTSIEIQATGTGSANVVNDYKKINITVLEKEQICPAIPTGTCTQFTVQFETNGGNKVDDTQVCVLNGLNLDFPVPVKAGYQFLGWYTSNDFTVKVDNIRNNQPAIFTEQYDGKCRLGTYIAKLYAKWEKAQVVNVPDTGISTDILLFAIGSVSVIIGFSIISLNRKKIHN